MNTLTGTATGWSLTSHAVAYLLGLLCGYLCAQLLIRRGGSREASPAGGQQEQGQEPTPLTFRPRPLAPSTPPAPWDGTVGASLASIPVDPPHDLPGITIRTSTAVDPWTVYVLHPDTLRSLTYPKPGSQPPAPVTTALVDP